MPSAAAASVAPALTADGKAQPEALTRLIAPTRAKLAARSSALSHHPSWTNLSTHSVPVPVPSLTQCRFRTLAVSECRKIAAYKEQGDRGRPLAPHHNTALDATSHPSTSTLTAPSRLCPNSHHRSCLERRFPSVERGVGRSERGMGTSKVNPVLRDLGSI